MKTTLLLFLLLTPSLLSAKARPYPIVDTGVKECYSDSDIIKQPRAGQPFAGQDACYKGHQPAYTDHQNGTITDRVTGLMWAKDMGEMIAFDDAPEKAKQCRLGGYRDWRVPTIKELYSLIDFNGRCMGQRSIKMFINTQYFNQPKGDTSQGEREIDAQTWSATEYVGKTMYGDRTVFGVNFVDGRIKGYPVFNKRRHSPSLKYLRLVRGNKHYGKNKFKNNGDGTISDYATGLMWQQADDGKARNWQDALAYAEALTLAGKSDWRLPNAKELQSIVDYSRSTQTTKSAAINAEFKTTSIEDWSGKKGNYPYFWTSTTHLDGPNPYSGACYFAFGDAYGVMNGVLLDVHGAGCQRSDPKAGSPADYPQSHGPQGDVRYMLNYVRCVRDIKPSDKK
ncbi:MAG: DUF1566 domain-containing protein [Akkermansia sp.]